MMCQARQLCMLSSEQLPYVICMLECWWSIHVGSDWLILLGNGIGVAKPDLACHSSARRRSTGLVRQIVRLVLSSKGPRPLGGDEPTLSLF
jgi:hypothetical protein